MGRLDYFLLLGILLFFAASAAAGHGHRGSSKRALYFLDNNATAASIISLKIAEDDGHLSSPTTIPTGGKGLRAFMIPIVGGGPPRVVGEDSTFSQDSIIVDGNYIFAVNPGSHTLSMFLVDDENPWVPTLVGEPADTLGEFPMSVAYSSKINTACVLNGGKRGGVTCFSVDPLIGLTALDKSPRSISGGLNQTTPPLGISNTASDIVFNPSSTALFAILKGNVFSTRPFAPGQIYVWPVISGKVSRVPVSIAVMEEVPVPFSGIFLGKDDSRIFLSDISFGVAVVNVHPAPSFHLTVEKRIVIPYNLGSCWLAYQPITDSVYVMDALRPNITALDASQEILSATIDFESSAPPGFNFTAALNPMYGSYDGRVDRTYLYAVAGTQHLIVVDTLTNTPVQKLHLTEVASREGWIGLAIYPTNN